MKQIAVNFVKEVLSYDMGTGDFYWKKSKYTAKIGASAGGLDNKGYKRIELKGTFYACHRLAWAYVTGEWPSHHIDHINGNRSDNRFCNLRIASIADNKRNSATPSNNTSGYKGVVFKPRNKLRPWQSAIKHNKKWIYIGAFETPEEAHKVYCDMAKKLHGEFFRP
jgi:hypothetical protein